LRKAITVEQVVKAPIVAWPLGLFDCCGVSDGAACAIVCRADMARNFREDPVYVKALQVGISSGEKLRYNNWDSAHVETTFRVSSRAYEEAGIKNPREELSLMETHDYFSIAEPTEYHDSQTWLRSHVREWPGSRAYPRDTDLMSGEAE
jgi:acetyl-CoA C-acetyltransferase